MSYKREHYLLPVVLIIAAIFRFWQIDQPFVDSVSWRQSDTATIAINFYRGNWNILLPQISWNGPEPNYVGYEFQTITYIAAMIFKVFGVHNWLYRLIPILFSLVGIFSFYKITQLVWDKKHAAISALILAILPGNVYVDRSFLPDPVMLALVTTSAYLFLVYLRTDRTSLLAGASILATLGFLTKVPGIFVGIPMLYAARTILSRRGKLNLKAFIPIVIASVLVVLPVICYYFWAIYISHNYYPYYIAAGGYWIWKFGLSEWLDNKFFIVELGKHLWVYWTEFIVFLVLLGIFIRPDIKGEESDSPSIQVTWFFHIWMLAFGLYYLIAAKGLVANPTNLNLMFPAAAALAGAALLKVFYFFQSRWGVSFAKVFLIIFFVVFSLVGFHRIGKRSYYPFSQNGYELGIALREISKPNDLVVTIADVGEDPVAIHYSERRGWTFLPLFSWPEKSWDLWFSGSSGITDVEAIDLLEELRERNVSWLGIVKQQIEGIQKERPVLAEYLADTFQLYIENDTFSIYRFR